MIWTKYKEAIRKGKRSGGREGSRWIVPDIVDFEVHVNDATGEEIVILKFMCKNSEDQWCAMFERKNFEKVLKSLWRAWNNPELS